MRTVEPDWFLGPSPMYRRARYWVYDYRLMRGYGNGRVQSAWKALQLIRGRRVRISPLYWTTPEVQP